MDTTYIMMDRLPRFTKDSSSTSEDLEIISKTNTSLRKIGNDICPPEFDKVVKSHKGMGQK